MTSLDSDKSPWRQVLLGAPFDRSAKWDSRCCPSQLVDVGVQHRDPNPDIPTSGSKPRATCLRPELLALDLWTRPRVIWSTRNLQENEYGWNADPIPLGRPQCISPVMFFIGTMLQRDAGGNEIIKSAELKWVFLKPFWRAEWPQPSASGPAFIFLITIPPPGVFSDIFPLVAPHEMLIAQIHCISVNVLLHVCFTHKVNFFFHHPRANVLLVRRQCCLINNPCSMLTSTEPC